MGMGTSRRQGMPQTAGYQGAIDQFAPPPAPSRRFGFPQGFQFGSYGPPPPPQAGPPIMAPPGQVPQLRLPAGSGYGPPPAMPMAHGGAVPPLQGMADNLAQQGRYGDSMLVHMNPAEVQGIAALSPRGLSINPATGQPEAFKILPMLAGLVASPFLGPVGMAALSGTIKTLQTGDLWKGFLTGLTSFGLGKIIDKIPGLFSGDTTTSIADSATALAGADPVSAAGIEPTVGTLISDTSLANFDPGQVAAINQSLSPAIASDPYTAAQVAATAGIDPATTAETLNLTNTVFGTPDQLASITPKVGYTEGLPELSQDQGFFGSGFMRDTKPDFDRIGELKFKKDILPGGLLAAGAGAELGRLERTEELSKRNEGLDGESDLAEAEAGIERAMRQRVYDYGWPERGIPAGDPRFAPSGMMAAGGGLVSLNPSDYQNKRQGLGRLMGPPVRMQAGGWSPYTGFGGTGDFSAGPSASEVQSSLIGSQVISPDQMRQLTAAGHRPGIDPEIQFFREPEDFPSFLDPLDPNDPIGLPPPPGATLPVEPDPDDVTEGTPEGTSVWSTDAGQANRDRRAALHAQREALPAGAEKTALARQIGALDAEFRALGAGASAPTGAPAPTGTGAPTPTGAGAPASTPAPADTSGQEYWDSLTPEEKSVMTGGFGGFGTGGFQGAGGGGASGYQGLLDAVAARETAADPGAAMGTAADPAKAAPPESKPMSPLTTGAGFGGFGTGGFQGYGDLISQYMPNAETVVPPLAPAPPPVPVVAPMPEVTKRSVGVPVADISTDTTGLPVVSDVSPVDYSQYGGFGGFGGLSPTPSAPPPSPMPPAAMPPAVMPPPPPVPVAAPEPPVLPPSVADWSQYGGWAGLPSIMADREPIATEAKPKKKAKKKGKKKAKKKSTKSAKSELTAEEQAALARAQAMQNWGGYGFEKGGLVKMQDMGQVPEMPMDPAMMQQMPMDPAMTQAAELEAGIASVDPAMGDPAAGMDPATVQLEELTKLAIRGDLPPELAEIVIAQYINMFGQEEYEKFRRDELRDIVPLAQTEGMLRGQGDGMSDEIMGMIGDQQRVAVSPGEYIVPADVVSGIGNGSSDAGAGELDRMMADIRQARTGMAEQPPEIDPRRAMPA